MGYQSIQRFGDWRDFDKIRYAIALEQIRAGYAWHVNGMAREDYWAITYAQAGYVYELNSNSLEMVVSALGDVK